MEGGFFMRKYNRHIIHCMVLSLFAFSGATAAYAVPLGGWTPAPVLSEASKGDEYYRKGIDELNAGNLGAAETAFNASRKHEPKSSKSILGLAEAAFRRGQADKAGKLVQEAVALDPDNIYVQTTLGRYLYLKGRFAESEKAFNKAISIDPQAVPPRVDIGDLYMNAMGKPQEAADAYRVALALKPMQGGVHYALGNALMVLGKPDEAEAELQEAGRLEPSNPLSFHALGRFYFAKHDHGKALAAFEQALKAQPKFIQARVARGDVYLAAGDDGKAASEYEEAIKAAPKYAPAYVKIGMLHQSHKQPDKAEKAYLAAVKHDSGQAARL